MKKGISNVNEYGLNKGQEYILENKGNGCSYVYDLKNNYLTYCRTDSFENIHEIV